MTKEEAARLEYLKAAELYEMTKATDGVPSEEAWESFKKAWAELDRLGIKRPI